VRRTLRILTTPPALLAAITLLAALLRLVALDRLPPGLYHDEAYNGLDALGVLRGETPLFFAANNGREPLFIYLAALGVGLLGPAPGALRVVSAVLGILTVPATYVLGRALFERRVALLAAFLVATTVWTLNLSRVALRAVAAPPLAALALALLWRGLERRRWGLLVAGGVAYGALMYTYLAARVSVLALAFWLVYLAIWRRDRLWGRGVFVFCLTAAVVAAPLGVHLLARGELFGRAGQVSVFSPAISGGDPWGTLARHAARTALGFFWRGDFIARHNVPLRPVFDPLTAAAFLAGVVLAVRSARRSPAHALVLIWTGVMLLPTVFAEDAPHMLRASGVLPVLFFLPALGLEALYARLALLGRRWLAPAAVSLVLVLGATEGIWRYARHLQSPAAYYQFEAGAAALAAEANAYLGVGWRGEGFGAPDGNPVPGRAVYVAPRLWRDWASLRFLAAPAEARGLFHADVAWSGYAAAGDVALYLWPFEEDAAALELLPRDRLIVAREGAQERGDLEAESRLLYVSLHTEPLPAAPAGPEARWEEGIDLLGHRVETLEDGRLAVDLYWRAEQPLGRGYTVFVHLWEDDILLTQHDGPAAGGYYGTERWRPGDVVLDRHLLSLPTGYDPERQRVQVGIYWWETMGHLSLLDGAGRATGATNHTLISAHALTPGQPLVE